MLRRLLSRTDPLARLLLVAIALAALLPATGQARMIGQYVSNCAVFILFFLNGVRLPRAEIIRGLAHLRFLVPLALWVFGAMALTGWALAHLLAGILPAAVALGFLYLGVLPTTVQSATAYCSLARGNVANSVVAAASLNILGVFVSAPFFALLSGTSRADVGGESLIKVLLLLLLPFVLGQIAQRWTREWVSDHRQLVTVMDRMTIGIAVYIAFSGAVEQGIWRMLGMADWAALLAAVGIMLLIGFGGAWLLSGALRLAHADRIAFLFAGGQKSIAMGAPLAAVLFSPAMAGLLLIPLLTYHLIQLLLSAPLAARLRPD